MGLHCLSPVINLASPHIPPHIKRSPFIRFQLTGCEPSPQGSLEMNESQPDHHPPVQRFLAWEASPHTLRTGTIGPKNEDTKPYISCTTLNAYFGSPAAVKDLLEALNFTDRLPDADFIWRNYRRSFAILLSIHEGPMIQQFIEFSNLQDKSLPFAEQPANFPQSSSNQANLFSAFYERQWRYLPLELNYKMRGPIPPNVIIPFRVKGRVGRGRSAKVDKIEVDEDYNLLGHPVRPSLFGPSHP